MSEEQSMHTPTPWKVVSVPDFNSGLVYTSIQPVTVDEEAMKPLAMANGEYHVCRMSHTAAEWRFNYHRANAAFIVEAVNSYAHLQAENERLKAVAIAYREWEADLVLNGDWSGDAVLMSQAQHDRMLEIQAMREAAIGSNGNG